MCRRPADAMSGGIKAMQIIKDPANMKNNVFAIALPSVGDVPP
jgi:hypothetical protein